MFCIVYWWLWYFYVIVFIQTIHSKYGGWLLHIFITLHPSMHDVAMSMLIVEYYEYCIWKHFSLLLLWDTDHAEVDCCMPLFCNAQELIHVPIIHTRRRQWCLHYWYYYCSLVWGEYCLFLHPLVLMVECCIFYF